MSGPRRVIVGASGSPGNLCALRYAGYLARATGATLIPVHAWIPPGRRRRRPAMPQFLPTPRLEPDMPGSGCEKRSKLPGGSRRRPDHRPGCGARRARPGAHRHREPSGDILVIGAGRRGTLARVFSGRVSRYCLAHGHAPIVAIPPPTLASHLRHSPLHWMFWHRPLTPDRVLHDRGKTAA